MSESFFKIVTLRQIGGFKAGRHINVCASGLQGLGLHEGTDYRLLGPLTQPVKDKIVCALTGTRAQASAGVQTSADVAAKAGPAKAGAAASADAKLGVK
jgi:hypothetical protein